jgi:endonuclease/exonuclease/phosphatase family metal-dependent hydrolase
MTGSWNIMEERTVLSVATYNVHGWIGRDKRRDPQRVANVISELDAVIVGLQEATFPAQEQDAFGRDDLERITGLHVLLGPTFCKQGVYFGNVLMTRHPVVEVRRHDLSVHRREPRGALDVNLELGGCVARVIVTHLGLRMFERRRQVELIYDALCAERHELVIALGDFNEWLPPSWSLAKLRRWFGRFPAPRTFPSRFPVLALDRIWARPSDALVKVWSHRSPLARVASDHLPVRGLVRCE